MPTTSLSDERCIDERYSFMIESRESKPRNSGITFIQAAGPFYAVLDDNHLESLLNYASDWIDWYKFTVAAHAFQPPELVQRKLHLLEEFEVEGFPGGNFLELAIQQGVTDEFLEVTREVGFGRLEISTTRLDLESTELASIVEQAVDMGFDVHGETGHKTYAGDEPLAVSTMIDEMEVFLDAGADKVIVDSGEFDGLDASNSGSETTGSFEEITQAIGAENIVFEVPLTQEIEVLSDCAWLIDSIGPDVNIGNVNPNYINKLEQMRRGVGFRTDH